MSKTQEKNISLNSKRYRHKVVFTDIDVDTFKRMVYISIKFRISDDISVNRMYKLWQKIKELSDYGI